MAMNDLADAIDAVWKSDGDRLDVARRVVRSMGPRARLQLIALDVAGLLGLTPTTIECDTAAQKAILSGKPPALIRMVGPKEAYDLAYEEGIRVAVRGGVVQGTRSLASALAAAQVARDHSDGLAFLPPDLREKRLAAYADAFGTNANDFTRLVANFPTLLRAL